MNSFNLKFTITATDGQNPLGFEAWLDDLQFYNCDRVTDSVTVQHIIQEDESQHCLRFLLKNKTTNHTQLDQQGNIVKDSMIEIHNISFDNIVVDNILYEKSMYSHNFNGNGQTITENFNRFMGCNGTVSLEFETPIYIWLLENM